MYSIFNKIKIPKLKKTEESKYPTDRYLDNKIESFNFVLKHIYPLFLEIIEGKIKRFLKYGYKKFLIKTLSITALLITVYLLSTRVVEPAVTTKKVTDTVYIDVKTIKLKSFEQFIDTVGFVESTRNWKAVNKHGMLGWFQFDQNTLKKIGIKVDKNLFLNNPELQIGAFKLLLAHNKQSFKRYIKEHANTIINGKYITESGILMGFHLKPEDAINFLESKGKNEGSGDANKTTVFNYMVKFSGYDVQCIK